MKYKDHDGPTQCVTNELLAGIANELDRANKLKKIELEIRLAECTGKNTETCQFISEDYVRSLESEIEVI